MKKLLVFGISAFLLALLFFVVIEIMVIYHAFLHQEDREVDAVIILGARLYGETPSPALKNRLDVALPYLKLHEDVPVVVTGAQGEGESISEAQAMQRYLIQQGVQEERIIVEANSYNTWENLQNAKQLLDARIPGGSKAVMIASNGFHLFRSKMLAERLGMKAYGLPAKTPPTVVFSGYVREFFAVIKSYLLDRLE